MSVEDYYASAYVLFQLVAREVKTQIAGLTVVNDISGFGFKHMRWEHKMSLELIFSFYSRVIGVEQIRCIAAFMAGSLPLWFNKIHVVNHPR